MTGRCLARRCRGILFTLFFFGDCLMVFLTVFNTMDRRTGNTVCLSAPIPKAPIPIFIPPLRLLQLLVHDVLHYSFSFGSLGMSASGSAPILNSTARDCGGPDWLRLRHDPPYLLLPTKMTRPW